MTRTRDVAFIRKLCGLDLPPTTLAATLLPALRDVIPAHSAAIFWVDDTGEMAGLYAERMLSPQAMADYYSRHYQAGADAFASAFRRRAASASATSTHSFTRAEQSTPYFRDVMARLDAFHVLYAVLRDVRQHPFAQLSLYRGRDDEPFGREERATLDELLRYLGAGLSRHVDGARDASPSIVVEEQLGIVRRDGVIVSAPEGWARLLRLAALAELGPRQADQEAPAVEAFLRRVCEPALAPGASATRPFEMSHRSPWGRFVLKAFRLADVQGRRAEQVGLLIRREEPRSVTIVRGTGLSALSPQQREVALLIAQGRTNPQIAKDLGLTLNTASYHVKRVFERLDVNDRAQVGEKLVALAQARSGL
jgi:DNA-binding CsgD family transcriptional regulator